MAPTGMYIEANGLEVYYEAYGEGEPLMLIHGGTATSQSWASHLPAFTEHFEVFTPDSRGHGRTDNPTGELGYRVMADDAAALIDALGLAFVMAGGMALSAVGFGMLTQALELSAITSAAVVLGVAILAAAVLRDVQTDSGGLALVAGRSAPLLAAQEGA
jgi:pimeloyl-ACP methyl ester carboxylesterase